MISILLRVAFWVLIAAIATLSLIPYDGDVLANQRDKLAHLITYALLMVSARWAYPQSQAIKLALALVLYSLALELGQLAVPGRYFSLLDMVANAAGVALGLLLATQLLARLPFIPRP